MIDHKKIDTENLAVEERLGTIQVSILTAIHVLSHDGMHFESLLSLQEAINAFACTFWNICSITATGGFNDKTEQLIVDQKVQLDGLYKTLNQAIDYCKEVRNSKKMGIN